MADDFFDSENQNLFPSFENLNTGMANISLFESIQTSKSFREISNEYTNDSPFGVNSLFYTAEYVTKNIDFVKLVAFIKLKKDTEFSYEKFIGTATREVTRNVTVGEEAKFDRMQGIATNYTETETYETEIALKEKSLSGNNLQLLGRLNTYKAIVNINNDFKEDRVAGLEFKFDIKYKTVYYKIHFYYLGEERVFEKDNKNNIAFTIYSSNYEDFYSMLKICEYNVTDKFKNLIKNTFLSALDKANKEKDRITYGGENTVNREKLKKLNWLYENMPGFVAQGLDFNQTIDNIFKLSLWDKQSTYETTAAITNIVSKINSAAVYNYFYKNPNKLIELYNGFDGEDLIALFCQYLTSITFYYSGNTLEDKLSKARRFTIKGDAHIETNILFGDEDGKVALTNEVDLSSLAYSYPVPDANAIAFLFTDVEINNPGNKSNQFHPLDIVFIEQFDPAINANNLIPTIALYGKYLGDKGEWDDVKLAAYITVDIISIVLSGGALTAGVKGAARIFAIIDIAISTVNIASSLPAIRKELEKTEGGRWFLSYWPIISLCAGAGTISYYLAKGIIKYSAQLKLLKQNTQLIKEAELIEELIIECKKVVAKVDESILKKIDEAIEKLGIKITLPKNILNEIDSSRKLKGIINFLSKETNAFNPLKQALKDLDITLPKSKTGLNVDFVGSPYLYPAKEGESAIVKIKMTGSRRYDDKLAFELSGIKANDSALENYTWHHLDDYDPVNNTCTMQLVESNIHEATFPHIGSPALVDHYFNISKYNKNYKIK